MQSGEHKMKKSFTMFLCTALLLGAVGCSNQGGSEVSSNSKNNEVNSQSEGGDKKFSYWVAMNPNAVSVASTYNDVELFKQLQEKTGVKVGFYIHQQDKVENNLNYLLLQDKIYQKL